MHTLLVILAIGGWALALLLLMLYDFKSKMFHGSMLLLRELTGVLQSKCERLSELEEELEQLRKRAV